MNSKLALFHLLLFLWSAAVSATPASTLQLVHVLFRHGNRTPDKSSVFPNDLYINFTYEPFEYSQLTLKGKHTELEIGKYIRKTYGSFIPYQYRPNVVYAISTNFKRTKMSLQLVLRGIFPPLLTDVFEVGLDWQPIPYNVEPAGGIIGIVSSYCASYVSQYYKYVLSEEAQSIITEYKDLYEQLSVYAGFDVTTPKDAGSIYFTLKSEDDYGLALPEWASNYYPDILEEAASVDYEFSTANPTLKKFTSGFLLKKILDDSVSKKNGSLPDEQKIFLYSAHEFNIATMLRTLNVFYRHVPPFGATIFFEIHNVDGVYGLKLYYQDYKAADPQLLTIPGCSSFCPLDQLYEMFADVLPGVNDVCAPTTELM